MLDVPIQFVASFIFAIAILHTFSVKFFKSLAHKYSKHKKILLMLGEVEIVFLMSMKNQVKKIKLFLETTEILQSDGERLDALSKIVSVLMDKNASLSS